eukprot:TRINITY_DN4743_c0_g1_i2.p1 TRINITY_DN4743_c0_g1~~TRINITY_DN4743_c0_g1_i2.p1  ORF type:complete len:469 (+),score=121.98 TRINITY_DN4743_c0_g1_i2:44-1408(+)
MGGPVLAITEHEADGICRGLGPTFGTFLKAQEESPSLVLAHARIGDAGALAVASFLAASRNLCTLDLTGNLLTRTGAFHLAEALPQCATLRSVSLKHNRLAEGGEDGLRALCLALRANQGTQHVDLRHNGLEGPTVAAAVGEMLVDNGHLTHLELSWNPLGPDGGQVLLQHIEMNADLFDCQLTGCGIASETLVEIARHLRCHRIARGADMRAGPYQAFLESGAASPPPRQQQQQQQQERALLEVASSCAGAPALAAAEARQVAIANVVVTTERTKDLSFRLQAWRAGPSVSFEDSERAGELSSLLEELHGTLEREMADADRSRERTALLAEGFRDRELRYRRDITVAQDRLIAYDEERRELQAVLARRGGDLGIMREALDHEKKGLGQQRSRDEADEAQDTNSVQTLAAEKRELELRLKQLEERSAEQEAENRRLRVRCEGLRENIVTLRPCP